METLGLSGESKRSDGRLKSIFWPTVENAWDVNHLGQQGFWVCFAIAIFQLVVSAFSPVPLVIFTGIVSALVFVVGGMGVREGSWPAAALIFAIYLSGILYTIASHLFPGFLTWIAAAILLSNVRAAFIASEWKPQSEDEDRPQRFNETWADKLVDQLPAKLWRPLQIPFYGAASLLLLLNLLGIVFMLLARSGVVRHL